MALKAVPRAGTVALDSLIFIYYIEEHPQYLPLIAPLFEDAAAGRVALVASALTLLEVLVQPLRHGHVALAARYEALLTRSRGVQLHDVDRRVLLTAAQLRGRWPLRTPDAIHMATALTQRCDSFVTNDRKLPMIPGLTVVQLAG